MSDKLPYWQHPNYNLYNDSSSGYIQHETLKPITTQLPYSVIRECMCTVEPEKHDPGLVTYLFDNNSTDMFPSVCREKNYVDPGDLILQVSESWDGSFEIWIRRIREDLYLLSYQQYPNEPDWDSGEEAAWEGGNVAFDYPELTVEEKVKHEERHQREMDEINAVNAKYDSYPIKPSLRNAILIKSDPISLATSVYDFLNLGFPRLMEILSFCNVKHNLPTHFQFGESLKFMINGNFDRKFYNTLEACFKSQASEGAS
jgi:hypothetical protein